MDNGFICICCRRRTPNTDSALREKYIGICSDCNNDIKRVKKGTVFQGGDAMDSLFVPLYYRNPIKSAITRFKFASQTRYAKIFCEILYDFLKDWELEKEFDFLTAVPISRKRLYERGYSQTELLAEPLAAKLGIEYVRNCVYKKKHNPRQSALIEKSFRFENVKDVYLADKCKVEGKDILLLDDIYTSGATMNSCAAELKMRGAKTVVGIALAAAMRD